MLWFLFLTFAMAWALWMPALGWLRSMGRLGGTDAEQPLAGMPVWIGVLWFVGASSPSLVALALTAAEGGTPAVADLLGRLFEWNVGWGFNLAAWLGPVVLGLTAVGLHVASGGIGVRWQTRRVPVAVIALAAALPFGPLGEELGWRGFLLDELLVSRGAVVAALIVGFVWTFWHLPVFWAPLATSISGEPVTIDRVIRYWLEVTAVSVIMTWLFVETAGSLWISVGFHAAWNADQHRFFFAPFSDETSARVNTFVVALMVVVAVVLLAWPGLRWRSA